MQRMHNAKIEGKESIEIWGTGTPKREFLYVDDCADGLIFLMNNYNESDIINLGTGIEHSIKEIVDMIKEIVGYEGECVYNSEKPDGTMRKVLDISKIDKLGWKPKIELKDGIKLLYDWYLKEIVT